MQLVGPVGSHLDALLFHGCALRGVALLVGMVNELGDVRRGHCVQDVEHVTPVGKSPLRHLRREVADDVIGSLELWPQVLDREFIVKWDVHEPDVLDLHQLLLVTEHVAEEVFVHHRHRGQVELDYRESQGGQEQLTLFAEVLDEVGLAVELPDELGSGNPAPLRAAEWSWVCVLVH